CAVTTRSPRSTSAHSLPDALPISPSFTVQPAGIPDKVALSVSSLSPVAESPLSVIGPSSLPCHTLVAPNTGSSATPLAVTLRISTALVPAPSARSEDRRVGTQCPPRSGPVTNREPRSAAAKAAPLVSAVAPTLTGHPTGIPASVPLSASSLSPVAESPLSVIGPSSLPCHTLVAPKTGSSATPLAVTLRISTALVPAPSA